MTVCRADNVLLAPHRAGTRVMHQKLFLSKPATACGKMNWYEDYPHTQITQTLAHSWGLGATCTEHSHLLLLAYKHRCHTNMPLLLLPPTWFSLLAWMYTFWSQWKCFYCRKWSKFRLTFCKVTILARDKCSGDKDATETTTVLAEDSFLIVHSNDRS